MPARYIDSDIWADEWFSELSWFEQALWIGLFSKAADNQGRLRDSPALIRSEVFPTKDVALEEIEAAIAKFALAWRVHRYEVDGKRYLQILHWWDHQCPRFATPSRFPAPEGWTDHVRSSLRGKMVLIDWTKPEDHAALARAWIKERRSAQENAAAGSIQKTIRRTTQKTTQRSPAAGNNPDTGPRTLDAEHNGADAPGADAPASAPTAGPQTFQEWRDLLHAEKNNRPAVLMRMLQALYPTHDPPDFAYLGKVARQLGAARLAQLLWEHSTRPPVDDVLAYCMAVAKGANGKRASPGPPSEPKGMAGLREWAEKRGVIDGEPG